MKAYSSFQNMFAMYVLSIILNTETAVEIMQRKKIQLLLVNVDLIIFMNVRNWFKLLTKFYEEKLGCVLNKY